MGRMRRPARHSIAPWQSTKSASAPRVRKLEMYVRVCGISAERNQRRTRLAGLLHPRRPLRPPQNKGRLSALWVESRPDSLPCQTRRLDRVAWCQNTSRSDISICRGFSVPVMRFRLALVWTSRPCNQFRQSYDGVMLYEENCVWFGTLYISARNCKLRPSCFSGKFLVIVISRLLTRVPGMLRSWPEPALPRQDRFRSEEHTSE